MRLRVVAPLLIGSLSGLGMMSNTSGMRVVICRLALRAVWGGRCRVRAGAVRAVVMGVGRISLEYAEAGKDVIGLR